MMTSNAIIGYLNHLNDITLGDFVIEDTYVFDESLDFAARAIQYVTRQGAYEKVEGTVPDTWVIMIWSRGSLDTSVVNNRTQTITVPDLTETDRLEGYSNYRMASLPVTCKFVTNSIELAEDIEEYLFVLADEYASYAFTAPRFGDFRAAALTDANVEFEKEDTESYGSITAVTLNASISFPVILPVIAATDIQEFVTTVQEMPLSG